MAIVIKKRVSLDFLGADYSGSYLTFRKIPVDDFEQNEAERQKAMNADGTVDNIKATKHIVKVLKKYFVEGKFDGQEVKAEELGQFDDDTLITCLNQLTGQVPQEGQNGPEVNIDPKDEAPSTTPSGTAAPAQTS